MGITGDVARVMRAELGRRRSNFGLPAGGGVVDELCVSGCGWRLLDTAEQNNGRVLDWLQSERVRPFAIDVRSSDAHVQLRSAILEVKFDEIHSLPAATERTALRAQLEGLNLGCHSFVTDVGGFAQLASGACCRQVLCPRLGRAGELVD